MNQKSTHWLAGLFVAAITCCATSATSAPTDSTLESSTPRSSVTILSQQPTKPAAQSSWRVAQDISEREAFELAKDINTLRGWQAFLVQFPTGFRAEIAKSYVQKLRSGNSDGGGAGPVDDNGADDATIDYVRASELRGPFRLAARNMTGVYINNTQQGFVTVQPNRSDRRSGHWLFEQVRGTPFVRIRNRWKGTYLHLDRGSPQSRAKSRQDPVTHWSLERARDGSPFVVVRNRATGTYLWTLDEDRFLYSSKGETNGPRGHWRLVSLERDDRYVDDEVDEPITRPTRRIACINGSVRNGKCRCGTNRKRVRLGRKRFRCDRVRVQTRCGKGSYYSKSRQRCLCSRGYERVGKKCFRNEELDDDRGNTSCPRGFLLRKGSCVCPRGKKNIQGKCRRVKSGGGTVRPQIRCSKIKFAFTRGNTCKCAGGRIFTGRACVLPKNSSNSGGSNFAQCQKQARACAVACRRTFGAGSSQFLSCRTNCWQRCAAH